MGKKPELRLHHLNLPDEIVTIARTHRDLPPKARDAVESAISRYQEAVASVDDQLANLVLPRDYYIRQELREERVGLQESLRACQSLFSTMRRIPFETMGEIFAYYLAPGGRPLPLAEEEREGEATTEAITRFHASRTAGLLCMVCQHWKTIAMGTPSLWSDVKVKTFHELSGKITYQATPLVLSKHTRGLLVWMDRVTSHPWTLTRVDGNCHSAMSTSPWDLTGAVPLSQLVHRRASAYLSRLSVASWETAIGLGQLVCPRITSVVSYNPNGASPQPTLLGLPVMDNLEQAVLWSNLPASLPPNIPWPKLTHLFLGGDVAISQWKSVIRHCISLQRGMFSLLAARELSDEDAYPDYPCPSEVTLPRLKDLTFVRNTPFDAPIEGLSLPALTTLKVFSQWAEPLFNAQSDLFHNITHLTLLQHYWMEAEDLIRIFGNMPRLAELLFRASSGFKAMFDFMTFGREGKFSLRQLRALVIYLVSYGPQEVGQQDGGAEEVGQNEDSAAFPHQQLIDLVDSRTQAIRRGDFSSSPYALSQLENFVLRLEAHCDIDVDKNKKWMDDTVAAVQDALKSYRQSSGLKASVFGTSERHYYSAYDFPDPFYLEGRPFQEKRLAHWDEGFAELVDNCEEYSLYPLSA